MLIVFLLLAAVRKSRSIFSLSLVYSITHVYVAIHIVVDRVVYLMLWLLSPMTDCLFL